MIYNCISVRQPWAWSIFNAGTDVENRSFRYTGTLAIQVSLFHKWHEIDTDVTLALLRTPGVKRPNRYELDQKRGLIIGLVDVVDCVRNSLSKWAKPGKWHWILSNKRLVVPVPAKGRLGLFKFEGELEVLREKENQ